MSDTEISRTAGIDPNPMIVHGVEMSWVARISGDFKVMPRDGFANMAKLRVLGEGQSISFQPGESFGIRGRSAEMGNGLHIIQAVAETLLEGPAVLEAEDWGMNKVDRMVESERTNKPVIILACGIPVALALFFHHYVGPALPVFTIMPILVARIMWPKKSPRNLREIIIRRAPPQP